MQPETERLGSLAAELFGRRHARPGDVFMNVLEKEGAIIAPGVYNAMGAHIAKEIFTQSLMQGRSCSFNAVYGSGWAISAMAWRKPDMGFHDLSMMTLIGKHIIYSAHPLPVIFDAETGFGNRLTLTQTVQTYDEIGVALAHLEDQDAEEVRRCGNLRGKTCIPPGHMVEKIKSWLVTSKACNTSMRLMVRTDSLTAANGGLEDAIERGKRYMDVDYQGVRPTVLWADAMMDLRLIEKWADAMHRHDPTMILGINYSPNKDWTGHYRKTYNRDPPTYAELRDLGFRVIWHTILQARADMEASWKVIEDMAVDGAEALWKLHERQRNHPVGNTQRMSGADNWQEFEQRIGGADAVQRFEISEGYVSQKMYPAGASSTAAMEESAGKKDQP